MPNTQKLTTPLEKHKLIYIKIRVREETENHREIYKHKRLMESRTPEIVRVRSHFKMTLGSGWKMYSRQEIQSVAHNVMNITDGTIANRRRSNIE